MEMDSGAISRWLYPNYQLSAEAGVSYELRYVGSMPILVSIKSVDLNTRTKIARASIRRVCEEVGLKYPCNADRTDKSVQQFLGPDSNKRWAMTNVYLIVTSSGLTVEQLNTSELLFRHDLCAVSFASGGDADTMDFICYVAKDMHGQRMCYVFECPGLAQDVIITLGQAFQLGYQGFRANQPTCTASSLDHSAKLPWPGSEQVVTDTTQSETNKVESRTNPQLVNVSEQSSNMLPHTIPMIPGDTNPFRTNVSTPLPSTLGNDIFLSKSVIASAAVTGALPWPNESTNTTVSALSGTIVAVPATSDSLVDPLVSGASQMIINTTISTVTKASSHDSIKLSAPVVHLQSFSSVPIDSDSVHIPESGTVFENKLEETKGSVASCLEPLGEPWYVGSMSRTEAERLLRYEGDFLVRLSRQQTGQFVLSGMQDGKCKHLLLVDPTGLVRTKERQFDSIQELIDYHAQHGFPIRSADSEIRLIFPVSPNTICGS